MKLSRAFKSNHALFSQAIDENDMELMAKLMKKVMDVSFVIHLMNPKIFSAIRPDMAEFLATHLTPDVEKKWDRYGLHRSHDRSILSVIFNHALSERSDAVLAESFMAADRLTKQQQASGILRHIKSSADRQDLFGRIIGDDFTVFDKPEEIVSQMREDNLLREFDSIVAAGYAAHKDNEALLRTAAAYENRDFAKHLVTTHKADIDLAINTARFAGQDKVCDFLTGLRSETHPDAAPLQTFEEMAAELTTLRTSVKTLEQTVAGLAAQMEALKNPVAKLDKPPLRQHHP